MTFFVLADVTGVPGRNYVTGALGINVTASNRVYWRSKPFTGTFPVTGSVNLPVILQCSELAMSYTPAREHRNVSVLKCAPRPLTPRHKGTVCGDDETPLKEPRDSTRSALLTAVRSRNGPCRAPPGVHDLAAPNWRGGHV